MGCYKVKFILFILVLTLSVLNLNANTHVQTTPVKSIHTEKKNTAPAPKKAPVAGKPAAVAPVPISTTATTSSASKAVVKPKPKKKKYHHPTTNKSGISFEEIKSHETKKKLVIVEKGCVYDTNKSTKYSDSNRAVVLDTGDIDATAFGNIDFTYDAKEADYNDKKTLEQVKREIAQTTKPYILYFGASWCIPCRLMRETVFKAHDVKKYLNHFTITYVDVDNFDGMDIKELYKVNNIPCMVILNTQGKQIGRIEGSISSTSFSEKLKGYLAQ